MGNVSNAECTVDCLEAFVPDEWERSELLPKNPNHSTGYDDPGVFDPSIAMMIFVLVALFFFDVYEFFRKFIRHLLGRQQ